MEIRISKFHGAGNDFLIIEENDYPTLLTSSVISKLCNRYKGVGADGLIIIRSAEKYDFEMQYFNADGLPSEMCGNGARCAVAYFAVKKKNQNKIVFLASDGEHKGEILKSKGNTWQIKISLNISVQTKKLKDASYFVNTGVPHNVRIVDELSEKDVFNEGREYRNHEMFGAEGANINFVSIEQNQNNIRTYERGVENETLACGTGVAAAALVLHEYYDKPWPISFSAIGGKLLLDMKNEILFLTGPAQKVFETIININEI